MLIRNADSAAVFNVAASIAPHSSCAKCRRHAAARCRHPPPPPLARPPTGGGLPAPPQAGGGGGGGALSFFLPRHSTLVTLLRIHIFICVHLCPSVVKILSPVRISIKLRQMAIDVTHPEPDTSPELHVLQCPARHPFLHRASRNVTRHRHLLLREQPIIGR